VLLYRIVRRWVLFGVPQAAIGYCDMERNTISSGTFPTNIHYVTVMITVTS